MLSSHTGFNEINFHQGAPSGDPNGVFTDCFGYTQDGTGAFTSPSIMRLLCSKPSYFICQMGK